MKNLKDLIHARVEVIHHAGNIRTCLFGILSFQEDGQWFKVHPQFDSGSHIRFQQQDVLKVEGNQFYAIIYI